jgi:O-antigen/teichoic acid export membrane protein
MPRDIAIVSNNEYEVTKIFKLFSTLILIAAAVGFLFGQFIVVALIKYWPHLELAEHEWLIRLVFLQFLFQFSNTAHIGYWNGMQKQFKANLRLCIFATAKHLGALLLMLVWKPAPIAYVLSFVLFSGIEFIVNKVTISKELVYASFKPDWFSLRALKKLFNEVGVLGLAVLLGMFSTQADRLVLSKCVGLESFGIYVIVSSLGLAFMQLQSPLVKAFLPRIVNFEKSSNQSHFRFLTISVFIACVFPCMLGAILSPYILELWLNDSNIVMNGTASLRLILCAVAVNSIYQLPYQKLIIKSCSTEILIINVIVLIVVLASLTFLISSMGISAGGVAWLLGALAQLLLGLYFVKKKNL